jgi:hypothetical protein
MPRKSPEVNLQIVTQDNQAVAPPPGGKFATLNPAPGRELGTPKHQGQIRDVVDDLIRVRRVTLHGPHGAPGIDSGGPDRESTNLCHCGQAAKQGSPKNGGPTGNVLKDDSPDVGGRVLVLHDYLQQHREGEADWVTLCRLFEIIRLRVAGLVRARFSLTDSRGSTGL